MNSSDEHDEINQEIALRVRLKAEILEACQSSAGVELFLDGLTGGEISAVRRFTEIASRPLRFVAPKITTVSVEKYSLLVAMMVAQRVERMDDGELALLLDETRDFEGMTGGESLRALRQIVSHLLAYHAALTVEKRIG